MITVRVNRLTIQAEGAEPGVAQRLGRRVAELLGEAMSVHPPRTSRVSIPFDLQVPPALSDEMLAAYITRAIRARLW